MTIDLRYYFYCVPFALVFLGWEITYSLRQETSVYEWKDMATNMACGAGSILANVLTGAPMLWIYLRIYGGWHAFDLEAHPVAAWTTAFFGGELAYYWFHRLSHRTSFLWASHVVHHQSHCFNASVAVRQSWLEGLFRWPFNFPLAVIGVPPDVLLGYVAVSLMYQVWLHTKSIGKLGPLERVLNTPSHHRVHHGANAPYLDRNFGSSIILFDRLFGSHEPEGATPVVYGTVKPFTSANPIHANVEHWIDLGQALRAQRKWRQKLRLPFLPPEAVSPPSPSEQVTKIAS